MVELAREGMTMMVVTHEMGFARKVAHRVVFMDLGEIVEDALKDDFFGKPRRSGLSCSCPRFCTTDLPFRREHARPERQLLFTLFGPVGLYRAHIRSVWSHYLKLSSVRPPSPSRSCSPLSWAEWPLGAWLASRWSARLKNLLVAYGWIEAAIGVRRR